MLHLQKHLFHVGQPQFLVLGPLVRPQSDALARRDLILLVKAACFEKRLHVPDEL